MREADTSSEKAPSRPGRNRETLGTVARGYAMGAADVVPGVSGGTVALVLGIYERLVSNIHTGAEALGRMVRLDGRGTVERIRAVEWRFLVPLLVGIGAAVLSLAHLIGTALDDHPVPMSALFFGLVSASAIVAWRMLDHPDGRRVLIMLAVAVIAFFALGIGVDERTDASLPVVFLAGAIAVCAMILPGVSGSFLLLTMGMYELVIDAVNERDLVFLGVFVLGCVVGLALFSTGLNWALEHHRDTVLAGLTGLMVGSLRVLWPWPEGTEETALAAPGEQWGLALAIAVLAFSAVLVVAEMAQRHGGRQPSDVTA